MKTRKNASRDAEAGRVGEIYTKAAQLICERGYDATSLNEIAEAVGLTKPGLYHYIDCKESLLFEIMMYGMDLLYEEVMLSARAAPDAEGRLRTIIAAHARMIVEKGQAITIVVDEATRLNPAHEEIVKQRQRAYFDFVRDTLEELKNDGKLQDIDVSVAASCLVGTMMWVGRWYDREGRLTGDQVVNEVSKVLLGGLLRPAA